MIPDKKRLSIVFSLDQEKNPFSKLIHNIPENIDIWVCGAGPAASSKQFVKHFSQQSYPDYMLFCGFAGGLSDLEVGDVVLSKKVYNLYSITGISVLNGDQYLLDKALEIQPKSLRVTEKILMSTSCVLLNRSMKEKFNSLTNHSAECVDMETAALASHAADLSIPWLAVRVITDGIDNAMPLDFNALTDASGQLSMPGLLYEVLKHPKTIPGLISLGKHSSIAGKNLASFLFRFLSYMELI